MADDRVRMKAKTTFDNPLITVATKPAKEGEPSARPRSSVQDGDEFSTHEEHAKELEALGYAERIDGEAEVPTERANSLRGAQTPAGGAIAANRTTTETPVGGPAKAAKA